MHSRMAGALTCFAGICVKLVFLNLSKLLPVREPHAYTACRISRVGMFTINSPDSSIRVWLWRVGARLMARSGGLIEVGMAHATVVMFGLLVFPIHEISTVCIG